ncbi:MAG: mechanosensitive ion channel family protein [Lachnospiraceae bacterium]
MRFILGTESASAGVLTDITQAAEELSKTAKFLQDMTPKLIDFALQVVLAVVILIVGSKVINWIRKILKHSLERREADTGLIQFLDSLVKILLYLILVMTVLQKLGVQTTSVVAVLGSAGVAVGLALQGSLANFAGGVLILLLKPFKVGDYIIQGNLEGTVVEIRLFYTTLLTPDNKRIVFPNGQLSDNSLTNVTAEPVRRLDLTVGISYDSSIQTAKEVLLRVAQQDEDILKTPQPLTAVLELGSSEVKMLLRVWVPTEKYWDVMFRGNERIKLGMDEAGVQIPYPQLDVHMKQL